jgi:hypothetical protein
MRTVVGFLVAAAVGIHCSAPAESPGTSAPELVGTEAPAPSPTRPREPKPSDEPSKGAPTGPDHLEQTKVDLSAIIHDGETTHVTSTVVDPASGATYATGTFVHEVDIGGTPVKSKGDKDVFLFKVDATGTVEWVRAVGSVFAETEPRVTLAGAEVNVIGMTDGAMDCGSGPLATWSSDTFFFCVFGSTDGTSLSGGVFPTGTP